MNRNLTILALAIAMLMPLDAAARVDRIGVYNSFKGMGIEAFKLTGKSTFDSFALLSDTCGLLEGHTCVPGVRFQYLSNYIIDSYEIGDSKSYLYSGYGFSTGLVRDFGLEQGNCKPMAALCGTLGLYIHFPRAIDISISFSADAGFCTDWDVSAFSWYTNGISRMLYPEFSIFIAL